MSYHPRRLTPAERIAVYALAVELSPKTEKTHLAFLAVLAGPEGMSHLAPAWIKEWRSREESARAQGKG